MQELFLNKLQKLEDKSEVNEKVKPVSYDESNASIKPPLFKAPGEKLSRNRNTRPDSESL
jgi:hypothetical protein